MTATRYLPIAVLLALAACKPALAKPPYQRALTDLLGVELREQLAACRVCHAPAEPGQEAAFRPHTLIGERLVELRKSLSKSGARTDISSRLALLLDEDTDGDGASNLVELLSGRHPAVKADTPTPAEQVKATPLVADYRRRLADYPWRPFEPVRRPAVPVVGSNRAANPIDLFLAKAQAERGLVARPEADRSTLLRRLSMDLTGLPPTPEELHAFRQDTSVDAYERIVDRLLDSPRHGERWGRHWMDVWRYSDWSGWSANDQVRDSQRHIWHWRDWIVESINADKPYDRMITEMLAGDEIAPEDPSTLRATGYLARSYKLLSRETWLQESVEHTFLAFQGVTIGCARCHDHMFDAVTQKDYYKVRAIFEPHNVRTDRVPGQPDAKLAGLPRVFDANLTVPTFLYERGDERTPDKSAPIQPGVPAYGASYPTPQSVRLPANAIRPQRQAWLMAEDKAVAEKALSMADSALRAARQYSFASRLLVPVHASAVGSVLELASAPHAESGALKLLELKHALALARRDSLAAIEAADRLDDGKQPQSPDWHIAAQAAALSLRRESLVQARLDLFVAEQAMLRASKDEAAKKKVQTARSALEKAIAAATQPANTDYASARAPAYPGESSGRRLALAQWLTDRENPLTARVAVNHLWLRHFGQALVPSVFDFGRNGRRPAHPALLDWLAAELMDSGWSMKRLHRLIVTSRAYRQASTPDVDCLAKDPDNVYLWRMNSRRLEGENVRDQILFVSGRLDGSMGGPDIDHNLGLKVPRRSLYFRNASERQMEFLRLFDAPAVTECYQRKASITPQQALALANSPLAIESARILADKLSTEGAVDPRQFVVTAFERLLSRSPTSQELEECLAFLGRSSAVAAAGAGAAPASSGRERERLIHALMNHHEFVTVR